MAGLAGKVASPAASPPPPRTCGEAVRQARAALRQFRELRTDGAAQLPRSCRPDGPCYLTVELPVPAPGSLLGVPGRAAEGADLIRAYDEGDWPGGILQRFRAVRPLADALLDGYGGAFIGMLDDEADGLGVWGGGDVTLAALVTNASFPAFARLCRGEFGSRVLSGGHCLLALNPAWTTSQDIGQFWERDLRATARQLIEETEWEALFHCSLLRSSTGAHGLLTRSFPGPWRLYPAADGTTQFLGSCILSGDERPTSKAVAEALRGSQAEVAAQFQEELQAQGKGPFGKWW